MHGKTTLDTLTKGMTAEGPSLESQVKWRRFHVNLPARMLCDKMRSKINIYEGEQLYYYKEA